MLETGLRRAARVRAHRVLVRGARPRLGRGLRRGLRAPRAAQGRRSRAANRLQACHGRELAEVRRYVPRARAGGGRSERGGAGPLRARRLRGGHGRGAHVDRALSDDRPRAAALGVDRGRALVGRARRLPGRRARALEVLTLTPPDRAAGARRQPRGVDLQAGRASQRGAGLSCRGRPLPANHGACADVVDSAERRVRRGRRAHEAPGLDGRRRGPRQVPRSVPDHELNAEATKQLAFVYREGGESSLAAGEYERVAVEAQDPELEREALLSAGELYEQSKATDRALDVYERYIANSRSRSTSPSRRATRSPRCIASAATSARYHEQLAALIAADAAAGAGAATARAISRRRPGSCSRSRLRGVQRRAARAAVRAELEAEARAHGPGTEGVRRPDPVRSRRRHDGRDVLHGGDLLELQPLATRFERPTNLNASGSPSTRTCSRNKRSRSKSAIEVHEANVDVMIAAGIYNKWVEQSFARLAVAHARPLREGRAEHRSARRHRDVHVPPAGHRPSIPPSRPRPRPGACAGPEGPTIRLEVLAGAGFTITDGARVSPELRDRYLAAVGYLEQVVRARRDRARGRDAATAGACKPARRSRHCVLAHGPPRGSGREPRTRVAVSASPDRARGARARLPQASALRRRARNTSRRSRSIRSSISRIETSRSSTTCISATTRARCSTTRRTKRRCPTMRKLRSGSPTSRLVERGARMLAKLVLTVMTLATAGAVLAKEAPPAAQQAPAAAAPPQAGASPTTRSRCRACRFSATRTRRRRHHRAVEELGDRQRHRCVARARYEIRAVDKTSSCAS